MLKTLSIKLIYQGKADIMCIINKHKLSTHEPIKQKLQRRNKRQGGC